MNPTIFKGKLAEIKVEQRALEKGLVLCRPTTDARYDYILDTNGHLERVQVKYTDSGDKRSPDSVTVGLVKTACFRDGTLSKRVYNDSEVDVLLVYIPRIDKVLRFEAKDFCDKRNITIRLEPVKNNQANRTKLASDYVW